MQHAGIRVFLGLVVVSFAETKLRVLVICTLSLSPVATTVTAVSLCLLAAASETDTCRAVFVRCSVPARRRRTPNNTFNFRRLCAREPLEILTGAAVWRPSGFYLRRGRHMAVHGSVQMQTSTASPAIQASNVDAV